jgi:hypothetical protein
LALIAGLPTHHGKPPPLMSQATESLFAENHEHFFNSIGQTRTSSSGAARPLPPSADIGPGGQSVGQRQHVKDGWLIYTQEKNRKRRAVKVETPIAAPLAAAIEACPSSPESLTFLTNEWGRPFSKRNFNNWFRKQVTAAGLPDTCVPHGLRKAGCRIMAENDCTPHEIASVSGHASLKEVQRYAAAADRKRLAARAQAKVAAANNVMPLAVASGQ